MIVHIIKIKSIADLYLSIAICFLLSSFMFEFYIGAVFNRIGFLSFISSSSVFLFIWFILLLINLPTVIKRFTKTTWIIPVFLLVALSLSLFKYGHVSGYIEYSETLLVYCIPAYLIMSAVRDYGVFNYITKITSYILFIMCILYFFFFSLKTEYRSVGYDMVFGYQLIFVAMIIFENYLAKKNKFKLMMVITNIVLLLIIGSRGPIFVLVLYFMIRTILSRKKLSKKVLTISGLLLVAFIFINNYTGILSMMNMQLNSLGIYSRNLEYILAGNIATDGGRELIFNILIDDLKSSNQVFGLGLFSDRVVLNGTYAHNIALEFLHNYGVIFGTFLLVVLILGILRKLINNRTNNHFFVFSSFGIGSLTFSGSYLTSFYFFIMLAMLVSRFSSELDEHSHIILK